MSTGTETQWKVTWVILGVPDEVSFDLRLERLVRESPGKKGERARPSRGKNNVGLSAGLSCQSTSSWSSTGKQYGLHFGSSNLISLKIAGGGYGECLQVLLFRFHQVEDWPKVFGRRETEKLIPVEIAWLWFILYLTCFPAHYFSSF